MSFLVSDSGSKYPPVSQGTHQAICYGLIDIGTHYNPTFDKSSHDCVVLWEIPDERIIIKDEEVARVISKKYSLSLHEKANLYKDLVSWRGKAFSLQELEGFDLKTIMGANCLLQIIHNEKGGKTYSNISAILPLMKGMAPKVAENEITFFSFAESNTIPATLPNWIQDLIKSSNEWKALEEQGMGNTGHMDSDLSDCPF